MINLRTCDFPWKNALLSGYDTARLYLRPLKPKEYEDLFRLVLSKSIYRYVTDIENAEEAQPWLVSVLGKRNYLFYSVRIKGCNDLAGFIMFQRCPDLRLKLGGAIAPCHWNRGYASELLLGLGAYLGSFENPDPLYADVHPDNIPVRKALEKSGFIESPPGPSHPMTTYTLHLDL